jgi:uncharacterized protein (TIGR02466 family)
MKKISYYHNSIYKFNAKPEMYAEAFKAIKLIDLQRNQYNSYSRIYDLYNHEGFKDIHLWFLDCIQEAKSDIAFLEVENLVITQSWANKSTKGESHHLHSHGNSFMSGVFYFTSAKPGEGGETEFFTNNIPIWYKSPFLSRHDDVITVRPEAGALILFPSNLLHKVLVHESDTPRYTIAFNVFPDGQCGNTNSLQSLNIKTQGFGSR